MLISKIRCPYGCNNSIFGESTKTIVADNSNLLLDSQKQNTQQAHTVKTYTCQCCGNSFDTPLKENNRTVL